MYIPKTFSSNNQIIVVPIKHTIINFINFLSPKIKLLKNKNKIEDRIKPTGLKHKVYKIIKNIMLNALP